MTRAKFERSVLKPIVFILSLAPAAYLVWALLLMLGVTTSGPDLGADPLKAITHVNTTLAAERVDAAAGIVSTLADLAEFAAPLFHGKLLSKKSQAFLAKALRGAESLPVGKHRTWTLQATRKPYGTLLYKEGDGAGGVNTLMAYVPSRDEIFIGFVNSFGFFDEVDFMIDDVVGPWLEQDPH